MKPVEYSSTGFFNATLMQSEIITYTLSDIETVVKKIISDTDAHKVFVLYGEMGAGKTTFIKAVCEVLECQSPVSSPTYALINEYYAKNGTKIYHADLFRLKNIEEALNIGIEDYLNEEDCLIFIEWPQVIEALLPKNTVRLNFETISANQRTITINQP